ncbi:VacB/RNase II family 3'-5' exoribonuclease [Sphingomonas histidinilytica]|uniref:Ribonuclease R n=1 Tax=Rhizorhabdus histidinilytica TaxID=439228 RepID=A0A1T5B7K5_9SPHN|nr:VacB/RNase II family 3'-5' exoribonuclease [Rhizorhabdus histidinilytica]MBO9376485.1 VacB/RNase II family 3'-5' exoribonuclease [Rhizorhabdus histidinilytica]SKB42863.1 RNAse R [Rhizorhabdus histidinilytica]
MRRPKAAGLPTREQIIDFITTSEVPAGKREIARAFGLQGNEKIALKALLKDMADEGLIDSARGRAFHRMGGIPKVTVLRITDVTDEGVPLAVPETWHGESGPPPQLRVREMRARKGSALGVGDRILARTEEAGNGWIAHPMKKLARGEALMLGILHRDGDRLWLRPVDKREKRDTLVSDAGDADAGDLVLAEKAGRPPRITARVTERLGDPFAPRSFSLVAIHKHGIPDVFPETVIEEAGLVTRLDLGEGREDLRDLPIVAIDPADARDHDDAIWAAPDDDPANPGGFRAIVAIADVSFYVRPGSALDREAKKRGNSVYFPDRVVPMLPEALSADMCSLKHGEDRAAMVCHLTVKANGTLANWRFARAVVRIAANIAYEDAQAAIDGAPVAGTWDKALVDSALRPLWACWKVLAKARDAREPLDLDLPERRVVLDEKGRILSVAPRERLDAHRLVEDYMIAANVAAAKALEAKKAPVMYRDHEPPSREKLVALKDYLATFDMEFALGQVVRPATFNHILSRVTDDAIRPQIMEQVLRSQTQAYYAPRNAGHFGLALGSYAHFTSPIRRYADLLVHRSLVGAYGLETGRPRLEGPGRSGDIVPRTALTQEEAERMTPIGELISQAERRAMEAERETIDRYVAAYLSTRVGELLDTRITGVQPFGFFATVEGLGGDGLVPVSTLGAERFHYDEGAQALEGEESGDRYTPGMKLRLRLVEANPINGSLRFELEEGASHLPMRGPRGTRGPKRPMMGRRGRPANIRHKGGRRR